MSAANEVLAHSPAQAAALYHNFASGLKNATSWVLLSLPVVHKNILVLRQPETASKLLHIQPGKITHLYELFLC